MPNASAGVALLVALAVALGSVLVVLTGTLVAHRVLRERGRDAAISRAEPARRLLAAWATSAAGAAGIAALGELVAALRALPRADALRLVVNATSAQLPRAASAALGAALRDEPWVRHVLRGAGAHAWWRRLEAARLLAIVGGVADAPTLRRLLADPHVAVRAAATRGLRAAADAALVTDVVRALPAQPPSLQRLQTGELCAHPEAAEGALLACLAAPENAAPPPVAPPTPAPPVAALPTVARSAGARSAGALVAWAGLAAALRRPRAAAALLPHAGHADPEARAAVARALGACPSPAALRALGAHLDDPSPTVRAAAAQAAGHLGPAGVRLAAPLARGLADTDGGVRLHTALALAQLGEPGRAALRAARAGGSREARDTALFVAGLSDGALLELAAA